MQVSEDHHDLLSLLLGYVSECAFPIGGSGIQISAGRVGSELLCVLSDVNVMDHAAVALVLYVAKALHQGQRAAWVPPIAEGG